MVFISSTQLINFANKRRRQQNAQENIVRYQQTTGNNNPGNIKKDAETQTKYTFKKDFSSQTDPVFNVSEKVYESDEFVSPLQQSPPSSKDRTNNYENHEGMDFNVEDLTSPTNRKGVPARQLRFEDSDEKNYQSFRPRADSSAAAVGSKLRSKYDTRGNLKRSEAIPGQFVLDYAIRKRPHTRALSKQGNVVQEGKNALKWTKFI